jgi:hypothetical protein
MAAMLAVLGHQPADAVEAMEFDRFLWWWDHVVETWMSVKGVDPDLPGGG